MFGPVAEVAVKKMILKYIDLKSKGLLLVIVGVEPMGPWCKVEPSWSANS